jgi:TonB family protein
VLAVKPTFLFVAAVFIALSGICYAQNAAKPRFRPDTRRVSWDPVKIVLPVYPEEAKKAGVQGSVVLEILIDRNGEVLYAQAIKGPPQLRPVSKEAVNLWRWEPYSLVTTNGEPVWVKTEVTFRFDLNAQPQVSTTSSLKK